MKKILSLLLAMATTLSLAACGGSPAQDPPSGKDPADDTQQTEETSGIDAGALYAIGGGSTGGTFNAMGNLFVQFFNTRNVSDNSPPPQLPAASRMSFLWKTAPQTSAS